MFAKLTALVGGGYTFPYNVEEAYPSAWGQWTHHAGTSKEDGSPVSVFRLSAADPNDRRLNLARNGVKRLKMLRHPNVLAYKDGAEVQEKGQTVVYIVTQQVKPLSLVLEELNLSGQQRDEYLAMGILHITNAVSFMNNDCKLIHGNICLDAIVVTDTLDWKLHGFDLLSELSLPPDHCLTHASWMVGAQYKAGELAKSEWAVIREGPPWAVDAWGLGCFIQEVFSQERLTSVENLRRTSVIPPALLGDYQKLLSSTPARRLNPAKVAESKFLNNRLVEVVAFMESIAVKDATDKDTFFKRLGAALPAIPNAVATRKLLPLLSHALEFGGAPPSAVSPLLQIGNTLESEEFNKRVVPTLSKLFASPDRALRRSLLESIDTYSQHLTTSVLEEQIFVHVQTGFTDGNAYIRELTLKSVLSLAPKLSNKTMVGTVLKHLSRLQVDEEPSIRANTTVLLGNIAKYLGESTCRRVLLNAFTRALKDVFPPAKIAGLRAMVATQQYHNAEDAALRILPATAPLAIDPVPEVRAAALQVLDTFTVVLRDENKRRATQETAPGADGVGVSAIGAASHGSSMSAAAAPALAAGSSMLNWAVSSLISSTGLAVKPPEPQGAGPAPPTATPGPAAPPAARPPAHVPVPASASHTTRGSGASNNAPRSRGGSGEGWGDAQDGWEEEELHVDEEEAKARSRLSGTSKRAPAAHVALPKQSSAAGSGWDALPDDDAGGWEGLESAAPAPAPAAPAPVPRPRPHTSGGGSAAGPAKPKTGAMKLGAQKLGVSKGPSPGAGINFDSENW